MRVALFTTCVAEVFQPEVAEATTTVLQAGGCDVSCPEGQTCCGQPAWNAGFAADAARVAATTLTALDRALADGAEAVVVPAGSCAAMVRRFWAELFALEGTPEQRAAAERVAARTWELTEAIGHLDLPTLVVEPGVRMAWHDSCHLLRELERGDAREVLDQVAGCDRAAWDGDDRCCGFGGLFSVKLPEVSVAMADEKLASLAAIEPPVDVVVSADASCLLHLQGRIDATGAPLTTRHIALVLADALPVSNLRPHGTEQET